MDADTYKLGMGKLQGAFPREMLEMSQESLAVWWAYLHEYSDEEFSRMVDEWVLTMDRAPTIAGLCRISKFRPNGTRKLVT